jgi:hypothetical protein
VERQRGLANAEISLAQAQSWEEFNSGALFNQRSTEMQNQVPSIQLGRSIRHPAAGSNTPLRIALDENELATRWGLSVKTLRRWRQESLGPVFCKLGARVTYLISEVEAFERRVSRYSTSARAYQ